MIGRMPRPTRLAPRRGPARTPGNSLSRRSVLGAGLLVVALGAGGCGVRLEDDAPHLPLIPTREPIPAEAALLELLDQTRRLAGWAQALGPRSGMAKQLGAVHRQQATRLAEALRARGVPEGLVAAAEAGRALPAAAAPATTKALGSLEAAALRPSAEGPLMSADAHLRPMVCALLAQRAAAAALLGTAVSQPPATWPSPELAVAPLKAARAAVYGFEVVAAQSGTADAKRSRATLATLQAIRDRLEALAGSQAPAAELGYALPFPVRSPSAARRLARQVLQGQRAALAGQLGDLPTAESSTRNAAPQLIRWLGATEAELHRWGGALAPFPGLT